ncbi:MAG: hypothetical protein QME58_13730 [Bacteroidota bacterium]|nr:hypothetical protein [Bacteroidota bacterium]
MAEGWISVHRKITENEFYFCERFTKMAAFLDLLILAAHKPNIFFIRGVEIRLKRGELCYSIRTLCKRWKWNERTIIKFLNTLQNRQMIQHRKTNVTTIISINNYDFYQQIQHRVQHKIHTINNDNNNKNENSLLTEAQKYYASLNNKQLSESKSKVLE